MSEPIRRRRRAANSDPFIELPTKSSSPPPNIEPVSDDVPSENSEIIAEGQQQLRVSTSAVDKQRYIDRIRAEIIEDSHYSDLAEPNYWDGSHNRTSSDIEPVSEDYWNFLGRYE
ncbi:hypothetical protein [Myxosarcina sp. GI1]|uniref:hypothetical protein n=1 Tax=Myxosarcina sp. GI1 TaxID=1541065 RepID=UPI00056B0D7D|nr:hypothetical protein [Myxosarcina sp. GI1]